MQFLVVRPDGVVTADAMPAMPDEGFVWCDCVHEDGRGWVEPVRRLTGTSVFEDHLHDAENPGHPSYFDSTNEYEMIVFRALATRSDIAGQADVIRVKTHPVVFFVFPRVLVTIRPSDSELPTFGERLRTVAGRGRVPTLPEALMLRILNGMVDRYLELRQPLSDQLERHQRQLLDPRRPFRDWYALLEARREVRHLEDLCEDQLDALQEWRDERLDHSDVAAPGAGGARALEDALLVRTSDVVGHIQRVLNHARRMESSIESAVQLHFSATAYRTNEVMRTLTVITAVFLPLTLITGIFGMNFEFIPGLHSPSGFWLALGAMALIGVLLLSYFRARAMLSTSSLLDHRHRSRPRRATAPRTPARPPVDAD